MARKDKVTTDTRADLEAALGSLADHGECAPRVELRIRQAIKRAGLGDLLDPALEDLRRMVADVKDAQLQVCSAVTRLIE
jgi:hypothetical protein